MGHFISSRQMFNKVVVLVRWSCQCQGLNQSLSDTQLWKAYFPQHKYAHAAAWLLCKYDCMSFFIWSELTVLLIVTAKWYLTKNTVLWAWNESFINMKVFNGIIIGIPTKLYFPWPCCTYSMHHIHTQHAHYIPSFASSYSKPCHFNQLWHTAVGHSIVQAAQSLVNFNLVSRTQVGFGCEAHCRGNWWACRLAEQLRDCHNYFNKSFKGRNCVQAGDSWA